MEPNNDQVAQDERRKNYRSPAEAPIRLEFQTSEIEGRTENLSPGGVLVVTDADVRVVVSVDGEAHEGHVVRCHRLADGAIGWAIEFDTPID